MKVLHVAAEVHPWVKVGGLADVVEALPRALGELGVGVRLLLPAWPALEGFTVGGPAVATLRDLMHGGDAHLRRALLPNGVRAYLVDSPLFRGLPSPYHDDGQTHRRFAALAWAAAHLSRVGDPEGFRPDVLHAHDWQTGLAPAYLANEPGPSVPTVFTVHHMAYQGRFPHRLLPEVWLPPDVFHMEGVEFHGELSFLKAGLSYAWRITTVSPTYAREIQTPEQGMGLEGLLARRERDLVGILNGLDPALWDPATDGALPARYHAGELGGREVCRRALRREVGLDEQDRGPVFGVVSRLTWVKGLDLLLANLRWLAELGASLIVLGEGDAELEEQFAEHAADPSLSVRFRRGFDQALARRVFAGCDALLVPSRAEPCGLVQLQAMRYGALPVVRATGGLADTVVARKVHTEGALSPPDATGFAFEGLDPWYLGQLLELVVKVFRERPEEWRAMQVRAMRQDFGWERSARQMLDVYRGVTGGVG